MNNILQPKQLNSRLDEQENFYDIALDNLNRDVIRRQCGNSLRTKVRFGRNLTTTLGDIVGEFLPKGLGILAVTSDDSLVSDIVRPLSKADYRVEVRQMHGFASFDHAINFKPNDGQRLILGIGDSHVAAQCLYVGGMYSLPVILIPKSPDLLECLSPQVTLIKGSFKEFFTVPPPVAVVVDIDFFSINRDAAPQFDRAHKTNIVSDYMANSAINNTVNSANNFAASPQFDRAHNSNIVSDYMANSAMNKVQNAAEKLLEIPPKSPDTTMRKFADLPSAFGNVMSVLFALFDWRFSSLMTGEKYSHYAASQVKAIVLRLLEALEGVVEGTSALCELVADASLRLSVLMQATDNARYIHSGATQAEGCLYALEKYEQRTSIGRGEVRFIWSGILTEVYLRTLGERRKYSFVPPPNNNRRMDTMKEFFGISEFAAARKITPYIPMQTLKLYAYKISEYRDELVAELNDIESILRRAQKIFKRLYDDDGYSLMGTQKEDASLILALAPDFGGKFSYLTYLKQCGILDLYLN